MQDRIFPTEGQETLGSAREFTGINWDEVASRMTHIANTGGPEQHASDELMAEIKRITAEDMGDTVVASAVNGTVRTAKQSVPDSFKEHQFKSKGKDSDDDDDDDDDDEMPDFLKKGGEKAAKSDPCWTGYHKTKGKKDFEDGSCEKDGEKKATARLRKLHFASLDQISAEALEEAKAEGDTARANAIAEVRHEARLMRIAKLEQVAAKHADETTKIAKRDAYRMKIVARAHAAQKTTSAVKSSQSKQDKTATTSGFKAAGSLSASVRAAFAAKAVAAGFPREYVNEMLAQASPVTAAEQGVREVMASALPLATKKVAVAGMVKVAELDASQINRCEDYWINELGYDPEWVKDLFSPKYNSMGRGSGE